MKHYEHINMEIIKMNFLLNFSSYSNLVLDTKNDILVPTMDNVGEFIKIFAVQFNVLNVYQRLD